MQTWSNTCLGSEPANSKGKTYNSPPEFKSRKQIFLSLFLRSKMLMLQAKKIVMIKWSVYHSWSLR